MASLEWFESIPRLQKKLRALESAIEMAYASAGPRGQQLGSIGGGGGDPYAGMDSIIDTDAVRERDRTRALLEERMDYATKILYGRSGNGGVAKAIGTDDADMMSYHFLEGESLASIARRYDQEQANLSSWCERRIAWTCRQIDSIGIRALVNT